MTEQETVETETVEERLSVPPNGVPFVPPNERHEVGSVPPNETNEEIASVPPNESNEEEPETFPRAYVEELRQEAAEARVKAKRADDLATRLHVALTAATGRLADPSDLPFNDAHLDDPEALTTALDELLVRKPYLANRKPRGDVGQGATSTGSAAVDLGGMLRQRA